MINRLFGRAVVATLVLPGTVAFLVPLTLIRRSAHAFRPLGLVALVPGLFILAWCIRDFYVAGHGTLAPWAPPTRVVTVGLYRFSRNPMYVGVLLILAGWGLMFQSVPHFIYMVVVAVAFHLRVLFYEEPTLRRTFGDEFVQYTERVPRWF